MNKINYAELYGVRENEDSFIGAINRWKESGCKVKHLDTFYKLLHD